MAHNVMEQIVDHGKVVRGHLGVAIQPVDADLAKAFGLSQGGGALIADVTAGSPAAKAGLPTTRPESVEREANVRLIGSLYAPASNGWSFAPRIRSHKIAAGSPNVNGMFANRLTIFV
jgi:S1-C subfamily serine protease